MRKIVYVLCSIAVFLVFKLELFSVVLAGGLAYNMVRSANILFDRMPFKEFKYRQTAP